MEGSEEKEPLLMHCPECGKALDVSALPPYSKIECPHCSAFVRVRTTVGQYRIVGHLGEGGMSQVFRAVDMNLGREVALKILHQALSQDSSLTAMFEREAKLTASIIHPNVVKVYTVGEEHGYFFIAMELVHAISLEQIIANKGALSESEVLGIALDVARGLRAAHEEHLIHRDIKPGNMLVTDEGTTKLVDFGLAVQQGGQDESEDLWATPFYVPPEKLDGEPDTFRGDLYSLGATLYHALAGKPPFDANTSSMEELKAIKKNTVDLKSAAPGLSRSTVRLVEKMMAYAPSDRHASYAEVIAEIEEVRRRQFGVQPVGRSRSKKSRVRVILAGGFVLLGLVVAALLVLLSGTEPVDEGGLSIGIGNGERVITEGDTSIAGRFHSARELFVSGDLREADAILEELVRTDAVPASTRLWSHFFRGTIALHSGDEDAARDSFDYVLQITPETGDSTAEAVAFMKRAAALLSDPLPLLPEEAAFSPDTVEALGLFAAGLKNWQQGEFASAANFFRTFRDGATAAGFEWIGVLRTRVEPFLKDETILATLPNPRASEDEATLAAHEAALRKGGEALRTRGAAPRFVKHRLDRIGAIRELAAAAVTEAEAAVASAPATTSPAPSAESDPTPEEAAELARLKTLAASIVSSSETLLFSSAIPALQGESLETPLGVSVRNELVHACESADRYVGELVAALAATPYEAVVRRRAGKPIEAIVTASDADTLIVDLGFGPNEIEVVDLATDWLVEAGIAILPPPSVDSARSWEALVFFGLLTGNGPQVDAPADSLAAADPDFSRRWELLKRLR